MNRLLEITEALRDIESRMRKNPRKDDNIFFRCEGDAYRGGRASVCHAVNSIVTKHAEKYRFREQFIDDYRKEYGYPNQVICAIDGDDYNVETGRKISSSVEKSLRGKTSLTHAKEIAKTYGDNGSKSSETGRIDQLYDNGELFVMTVPEGEILSHYVPGAFELQKIKKVFDRQESSRPYIAGDKAEIDSRIDELIKRMKVADCARFPSGLRKLHGGHALGSGFDNLDWESVNCDLKYERFVRRPLQHCGFFSLDDGTDDDTVDVRRSVVNQALESMK